jgi:hypothetical protein
MHPARVFSRAGRLVPLKTKAASTLMPKPLFLFPQKTRASSKVAITGGAIAAAELALAGIDVQVPDDSCNRLGFGASLIRRCGIIHPGKYPSTHFLERAISGLI